MAGSSLQVLKLLTALGLTAALLLTAQPAAGTHESLRHRRVCLAILRKANAAHKPPQLRKCNFYNADLRGANLRRADLRGSIMNHAKLIFADLRGADFRGVQLQGADFRGSLWGHANFCDADLRGAIGF